MIRQQERPLPRSLLIVKNSCPHCGQKRTGQEKRVHTSSKPQFWLNFLFLDIFAIFLPSSWATSLKCSNCGKSYTPEK